MIVYQTKNYSFGVELIFSKVQFKDFGTYYGESNFKSVSDKLFFHDPRPLLKTSWPITMTEIYLFNH